MFVQIKQNATWLALSLVALLLLAAQCSASASTEAPATAPVDEATPVVSEQQPAATATAVESDVEKEASMAVTEDDRPAGLRAITVDWNTNWNRHIISYDELLSGGPPRDGIPSIDAPHFISPDEAADWLADNEPVIALEIEGDARAYPLQILMWHEIVNDTVGEVPVIVTFCPLCNSAITFDRRLDGEVYEFGTSGLLRNSDLVMYDRTTESLWQQLTGEGIVGDLTGKQLTFLPSSIVSFADFRAAYPAGVVLSRETGFERDYGRNPYADYDAIENKPFLFDGELDNRLPAMERVVTVSLGDIDLAYPLSVLSEVGVINDTQDGHDLVVFHKAGTSSALGNDNIAKGEDVGATGVFDPNLDGQKLTFRRDGDEIVDQETGSTWDILGQATGGPLAGKSLAPIVHGDHFWFSWIAFKPETRVYSADQPTAAAPAAVAEVSELKSDFEIIVYQGEDVLGGESVKLSEVLAQGKPVVLNMWAGLCPLCHTQMPKLQEAYDEYGDRVLVVGIDVGSFVRLGSREDGLALLDRLEITYPAGTTPEATIMRDYNVLGTPATYFLKPNGEIIQQRTGILSEAQLNEYIEELLEASASS
jgi:thiol-disulfide isomerase/thioredoxin